MTKGDSIFTRRRHNVVVEADRISAQSKERIANRLFYILGFILRWLGVAVIAFYCYATLPHLLDIPFSQLTLGMLGDAISKSLVGIGVLLWAFKKGEKHYALWGVFGIGAIVLGFCVWGVLNRR